MLGTDLRKNAATVATSSGAGVLISSLLSASSFVDVKKRKESKTQRWLIFFFHLAKDGLILMSYSRNRKPYSNSNSRQKAEQIYRSALGSACQYYGNLLVNRSFRAITTSSRLNIK